MTRKPDENIVGYYRESDVVQGYDRRRFENAGGRYVDMREQEFVRRRFEGLPKDAIVLDIATGTGRFALLLASMGYRVVAFDASLEMLSALKRKAEALGVEITCVAGDARNLPFRAASVDAASCMRFLWHYDAWRELIAGIMRVTRGYLVCDLMNRRSLRLLTKPVTDKVSYQNLILSRDIDAFLDDHMLEATYREHAFGIPYIVYRKLPFLVGILKFFDRILCAIGAGTVFFLTIRKKN
ncbi:MAG: methyltransferase domain-containing protein [Verrucomicrobia bacterium]|nr:methyltransferase domain-containing protein [Verrucomicrobiota bacterium]